MKRMMKEMSKRKEYLKIAGYMALFVVMSTVASMATLEDQITKASDLMLGKVAGLLLGGSAAVGGALQIKAGNILMGGAVLLVAIVTGIAVALIKSGSIFAVLS